MRLKDREAERTDWSTEPEASFSPEEFHANECTFFLWPRYSLVSRPPGQSTATMRRTARAWRRREREGCERANTFALPPTNGAPLSTLHSGLLFRAGWNLGIFFVFWQGSHFRMMFFTLRFHLSSCWRRS